MKLLGLILVGTLMLVTANANAANVETSGWETFPVNDTGAAVYAVDAPKPTDYTEPLLGKYGNINELVVSSPVHSGNVSLQLTDMSSTGPSTPQAYIGWVENLQVDDQVTANCWVYDTTPTGSPSGRLWAHYNANNDIEAYDGSTGVGSDYPAGTGWSLLSYTWTYAADDYGTIGDRTGLVIEMRTYSTDGDTIWIDDLEIIAPDYAVIAKPELPEPATLTLLALGGLVALRRRR